MDDVVRKSRIILFYFSFVVDYITRRSILFLLCVYVHIISYVYVQYAAHIAITNFYFFQFYRSVVLVCFSVQISDHLLPTSVEYSIQLEYEPSQVIS